MTMRQASEKLGVSTATISRYESASGLLDDDLVRRMIGIYQVSDRAAGELLSVIETTAAHERDLEGKGKHRESETLPGKLSRGKNRDLKDVAFARDALSVMSVSPIVPRAGVFISYRRTDQPALAGRLYDKLEVKFGASQVFMDVDSIDLGLDFVEVLNETLARCKVLLVVIGRDWLNAIDEHDVRRLDNPGDYVRIEIETALERNIRVIPILVDGTRMPQASDLPKSISGLARRNGRDIWNARFNSDCLEIISTLERILGTHDRGERSNSKDGVVPTLTETRVLNSNDFNVQVARAIQQTWSDRFGDTAHIQQTLTRSDGGVDGLIWPQDDPSLRVAFKTFPSPETKLRSFVAEKSLADISEPCLIVTRLPLHPGTRATIEKAYSRPLQFLRWSGAGNEEALEISLRILRDSLTADANSASPQQPAPPDVLRYIRDVHNRVSQLAHAAIDDHLETVRAEDKVDSTDFVTILAPAHRLNAEFALKVAWAEDQARLAHQVRAAKQWMRDHGMWGVIASRQYLTKEAINDLSFNTNERHIQLLLWRGPQDDEAMKQCLRRIAGSGQ
jgi:hypothetical protein